MGLTKKKIKQDKVRDTLTELYEWILEYQIYLVVGLGLLVVGALGTYGWQAMRSGQDRDAQYAYAKALEVYNAEITPEDEPSDTDAETPKPTAKETFKTVEERNAKALEAFDKVADDYSGFDVGQWARYLSALVHLDRGETEQGHTILAELTESADVLEIRNLAALRLADDAEADGNADDAISYTKKILDAPSDSMPREPLLMRLARNYEKAGDDQAALEQYRKIEAEYPTSQEARTAGPRIKELEEKLGTSPPEAGETPPESSPPAQSSQN